MNSKKDKNLPPVSEKAGLYREPVKENLHHKTPMPSEEQFPLKTEIIYPELYDNALASSTVRTDSGSTLISRPLSQLPQHFAYHHQ